MKIGLIDVDGHHYNPKKRVNQMTNGQILSPGDPCPCCGEPIKTSDPEVLLVLSWLAWVKGERKNETG